MCCRSSRSSRRTGQSAIRQRRGRLREQRVWWLLVPAQCPLASDDGDPATIALNRPDKLSALDLALASFEEAAREVAADSAVATVVVRGHGLLGAGRRRRGRTQSRGTTESAAGMTAAWNIGSTTRPRSPGPAVWARWTWTTFAVTAPWLRTAPFGAPVVPLVYIW